MSSSIVLDSNLERIRSIVRLIDDLGSSDFPYSDSREVLTRVRAIFAEALSRIESHTAISDKRITHALCSAELRKVFDLFPLLGFTIRSTDVRNAFEVHRPFLRIVRALLGPSSGLVVFSEWDYSPFTFLPPTSYGLADVVIIGIPASEAGNALIFPLAGHELGHNVWAKKGLEKRFGPLVQKALVSHITTDRWKDFKDVFPDVTPANIGDIIGQQSWQIAWRWAMRQCEELFCDFVGMSLFREAYLHSSSYLLAPGLPTYRCNDYPGSKQRAEYQVKVATQFGIAAPLDYADRFENEDQPADKKHRLLLSLADHTAGAMVDYLALAVDEIVTKAGLVPPSDSELDLVAECYGKGVPAQGTSGVPAAINAAWRFFLGGFKAWQERYSTVFDEKERPLSMLSDLVFKTIEVHEIEFRTRGDAAGSK